MSCSVESAAVYDQPSPEPGRRNSIGIVNGGVFLAVVVLGVAAYLTPLQTWLAQGQPIKDRLASFGLAAPLVFTVSVALLTVVGLPRLLLCSLGGMAFGFAWGLAWTQLGTLLGSYLIFLFVRWRGRDYALGHYPRLRDMLQNLQGRGLLSVVLIRQLPLNGFYNNLILGLTPVSHAEFLLGSLLGFLPLGLTACLLGAGLIQGDWLKAVQYVAVALACSVTLGLVLKRLAKRQGGTCA